MLFEKNVIKPILITSHLSDNFIEDLLLNAKQSKKFWKNYLFIFLSNSKNRIINITINITLLNILVVNSQDLLIFLVN